MMTAPDPSSGPQAGDPWADPQYHPRACPTAAIRAGGRDGRLGLPPAARDHGPADGRADESARRAGTGSRAVSRTIRVPDYGASGSLYLPMEIPEPGEPGYLSPADPLPVAIAREQAIEEALSRQAGAEQAELAELKAGG